MKKSLQHLILFSSIFFILLISLSLVSAQSHLKSPGDAIKSVASSVKESLGDSIEKDTLTKFLLFFLIALIIYAISDKIPFLEEKSWLSGLISIVIAILATLYLKVEEINTILVSYNALGIAITIIIPFIIIAVISKGLHEKQHHLPAKLLWILFIVALILKYITASDSIGAFGQWFSLIAGILALIMLFLEKKIYVFLLIQQIKNARETAKAESLAEITTQLDQLNEKIRNASNEAIAKTLIVKYNRLVKRQNELGGNYGPWSS
ncbi:MAG: hypothetical protein AABW65_02090 [Nanoarchaeota archaeon]